MKFNRTKISTKLAVQIMAQPPDRHRSCVFPGTIRTFPKGQ